MCEHCENIAKKEAARARADASSGAGPSRIGKEPRPVTVTHKPNPMDEAARQKKALIDLQVEEAESQKDIEAEIRRQKEMLRRLLENTES